MLSVHVQNFVVISFLYSTQHKKTFLWILLEINFQESVKQSLTSLWNSPFYPMWNKHNERNIAAQGADSVATCVPYIQ